MRQAWVLTVIGSDRPGLVESVAEVVAGHGGNWEASRMAHLGGQFAGMLRVSAPAEASDALLEALRGLEAEGLKIVVAADEGDAAAETRRTVTLEVIGHDRPGIVQQISAALARRAVNVEELATSVESAAMSGETLFRAVAKLCAPADLAIEALRDELERIGHDLQVDVALETDDA